MVEKSVLKVMMWLIFLLVIALIFKWYDWKLFIIIMLFGWASNLDNRIKKM